MGDPKKWIVLLMDNPIYKMDDEHGWPHFRKPPFIYIYIYMYVCMYVMYVCMYVM